MMNSRKRGNIRILKSALYRGSYMSTHILLNLSNHFRKSDKMLGLPSILSLFCNEFDKFNNTGARKNVRFYLSHDIKIT